MFEWLNETCISNDTSKYFGGLPKVLKWLTKTHINENDWPKKYNKLEVTKALRESLDTKNTTKVCSWFETKKTGKVDLKLSVKPIESKVTNLNSTKIYELLNNTCRASNDSEIAEEAFDVLTSLKNGKSFKKLMTKLDRKDIAIVFDAMANRNLTKLCEWYKTADPKIFPDASDLKLEIPDKVKTLVDPFIKNEKKASAPKIKPVSSDADAWPMVGTVKTTTKVPKTSSKSATKKINNFEFPW
jgi:hypothetical protein